MVWEACAAVGVRPPGCKECWEDCDVVTKSLMIAFQQTQSHEKHEEMKALAKAGVPKI